MRVLVVEDEGRMASVIRRSLAKVGMAADVAGRGEDAIWMAQSVSYDAIVLDVMLPGLSGFETCRVLRDRGVWSPVLMLTAREAVRDRVEGLDSGADAYLVKPFALAELHARLRSLARRGAPERPAVLAVGDLSLDPARREVRRGAVDIALSAKEFALLEALMRRRGDLGARQQRAGAERRGGVEHAPAVVDELGEALAALDERRAAQRGQRAARVGSDLAEVLGAETQVLVERVRQVAPELGVEEQAGGGEHERHGDGERRGHPDAQRRAPHRSSSRMR